MTRDRIVLLLRLARDSRTPTNEARAARLLAERHLRLLGLREKDLTAEDEAKSYVGPDAETIVIGDPLLVLTESSHHFRVAKIEPPARVSSRIVVIPKSFVRRVEWLTIAEIARLGWQGSSRVTRSVAIDRSYFAEAVRNGWHVAG